MWVVISVVGRKIVAIRAVYRIWRVGISKGNGVPRRGDRGTQGSGCGGVHVHALRLRRIGGGGNVGGNRRG